MTVTASPNILHVSCAFLAGGLCARPELFWARSELNWASRDVVGLVRELDASVRFQTTRH